MADKPNENEPSNAPKPAEPGANKPDAGNGYPEGTPVAEMDAAQQAAYWKHQARKHENRNAEWTRTAGGKTAEQVAADQAELEELRRTSRTESENAVADARREGEQSATAKYATKLAAAEFRAALGHVEGERRDQIIAGLSLGDYLTSDGDVDTDKVKSFANVIAPSATEKQGGGSQWPDMGQGSRGDGRPRRSGSVAEVMGQHLSDREKST